MPAEAGFFGHFRISEYNSSVYSTAIRLRKNQYERNEAIINFENSRYNLYP